MIKKYIIFVFAGIALAAVTGFYLYNKPVKSISGKDADIVIRAEELLNEFELNENAANLKYLDRVVSVTGIIKTVANEEGVDVITLKTNSDMAGVICKMEKNEMLPAGIKPGDAINIKGICTGMLMDVILVRCVAE